MPDQNQPNDLSQNPVQGNTTSDTPSSPRPVLTTEELPVTTPSGTANDFPLPSIPEASDVPPPPPGPEKTDAVISPDTKTQNITSSFDLPPVIGAPPKKKFGGKKVISTILGLVLLLGGVGVGVNLVRQQQDIREEAKDLEGEKCSASNCSGCANDKEEWACLKGECKKTASKDCKPPSGTPEPGKGCDGSSAGGCQSKSPGTGCGNGGTCVKDNNSNQCSCQGQTTTPTAPPPTSPPSAKCLNVKAYDASFNPLTTDQLKALKTGDKVRFAVAGSVTSGGGTFDKARFKINSTDSGEVTTKKPSSEEFYYEFTIPATPTAFNITAQIHHTTLGWSN